MRIMYFIILAIAGIGFFIRDINGFIARGKPQAKYADPVALVRVDRTVYHCQTISEGWCGLNARCGRDTLTCIRSNYEIQYLTNLEPKFD